MDKTITTVRARFAPSPTGYLHIGGARTALFNWAFIEHFRSQGKPAEFVLRIEDTDMERNNKDAINAIIKAMDWLELNYQGEAFYQSQRLDIYKQYVQKLIDKGLAYKCYASKEELDELRAQQKERGEKARYDRRWYKSDKAPPEGVKPAIRFKNPDSGTVRWQDLIKGNIAIDNAELDDFVIMRPDGVPTYNFANVVDDSQMAITHVIRGDDHVNNTPKQINIYLALGLELPEFAHLPMIHGDDGEKLSKRHGAVNVIEYCEKGFLPEALLNYLARLGFSHGDDEVFSLIELANWFTWKNVQSSPARFDNQKLQWLNQQYIIKADSDRLNKLITKTSFADEINSAGKMVNVHSLIELYKERCHTVLELAQEIANFNRLSQTTNIADEYVENINNASDVFSYLIEEFKKLTDELWNEQNIHDIFQQCLKTTNKKMGLLGVPLRIALLGKKQSPAIDKVMATINRQKVIEVLEGIVAK